ncbi:hypothetical protein RND81_12G161000 [Saponaria officinalis]|uniref:Pentatricopeptide repeat-containing protein n=1 Tax=Saponaria officinalis TaxID=3572 RepID=A0AAW1HBB1_SAPOF
MAGKLKSLMISNKISNWVCLKNFASICGAICAQNYPEIDQKLVNRTEIDPRIQFLKNDLCPDNLIRVLDKTHDLNSAIRVFKWASLQKQFSHTAGTYSKIVSKLGLAGNVDEMEGFCSEMVKFRGGDEALGAVLDVFVSNGRLDEAMRVVLVLNSRRFKLCLRKWNNVLSGLVDGKRGFRDVMLMYKEMVKSGTVPDVDTLNNLIKALFDANMVDKALDQFRRMNKKRCVPNCRTFEIVIYGLLMSNRVDESVCVMNEMFEDGVIPDLSFCNKVIPLFSKENKLEQVMKLFDVIKSLDYELDFSTYESLINCLCLNMRISEAIELFDKMRNSGFNTSADVLMDLLNACCKLGKLDEGRKLLDDNQVVDTSPYNVMIRGYCDARRFLAAKDLLQKTLLMNVADDLSFNILFQGLCFAMFVNQAREVLGKMIISSHVPDSTTYSAFVTGECYLGKYNEALNLFQHVAENDGILDPYSYGELIKGLCKLEKFQEATEVFMYMSLRNSVLQSSQFSLLIEGLCATAKVDEAMKVLNFGHIHQNPVIISAYSSIMRCLLKLNRPNNSLFMLPQILKRGLVLDTETYCILIQCVIAMCETKYCVSFLNLMVGEDLVPDHETLASALPHFAYHSKLQTIWVSVDKLCRESQVIDSDMFNLLINGLYKEGFKTEACRLLDYMLEKGWVPDASTHGLLIGSHSVDTEPKLLKPDNFVMEDEVSSILCEGLGET